MTKESDAWLKLLHEQAASWPEMPEIRWAIAEIERLKTANAQMLEHGREMWADVERLRAALRDVYEAWAGSDGFIPQTAAEAYQERIIHQMRDAAQRGLGAPVEPGEQR